MAKRYVLVKSDGEGPKPCAFFASAAGCRNGAGCKFLHGDQPTAGSLAAKSQPPPATKTKPAVAAVTAPAPTPAAVVAPTPAAEKEAEAERAAKKKAKKKAKKEKAVREAAEAAAVAAAAAAAQAPAPAPAVVAPAAPVAAPVAPPPTPAATAVPVAPVAAAPIQTLSKTQAKKQAFREKAARKAEAAAAAAAAAAANAAAVAAAAAVNTPPVPAPAAVAAAPATVAAAPAAVSGAAVESTSVVAANGGLPISKKKKRKNKKKANAAAAVTAQTPATAPVTMPAAAPAPAPAPTGPPPPVFHPMPPMSTPPQPKPAKPVTRVCSFFNKKKGCQVGALCPFLHQGIERGGFGGTRGHSSQPLQAAPAVPTVVPPPASAVTVAAAAAPAPAPAPTPAAAEILSGLPFAVPPKHSVAAPAAVAAAPVAATVAGAGLGESPSARRTRKRGRSETPATVAAGSGGGGGIFDGLPISPFVMPGTAAAAAASKEELPAVAAAAAPVGIPHPKADVWQVLVDRTRAHPKFAKDYGFETDATWIKASPCGESCSGLPQVVAVDCEMCMSEDPLSKERNGKELLRMSIVRGEDGERLMDTLVRPSNPVVDWRTDIHGVAAQHLEGVMFTHRHAQVAISRICCQHTVIIGHALNNDLTALKMNHKRVVDTSFLFEGIDKRFSTPSLKDVVKEVLKKDIQGGNHDSVKDAQHTLEAARYALGNTGAPLPGISRSKKSGRRRAEDPSQPPHKSKKRRGLEDVDGVDARSARAEKEERSLMVHRLPAGTTQEQLLKVMQKKTKVIALSADPVEFSAAGTGKTQVVYATKSQADIAFNGIPSNAQEDTSGRLQKKIYTSVDGKKYIAVRHALVMTDDVEEETGLGLTDVFSSSGSSSSSEGE